MENKTLYISLVLGMALLTGCRFFREMPHFNENNIPPKPDYSNINYWAAFPGIEDPADKIPGTDSLTNDTSGAVDVFFLHPTSHNKQWRKLTWNASLQNNRINKKTDRGTIQFQASAFNKNTRVFAPRYRQVHINGYFTDKQSDAKKAFDVAYSDVKAAFEYYLKNENKGRPIVIAAHSQGSTHSMRLLREFFDGKPLQNSLVAAYLPGMIVRGEEFKNIPPCRDPQQTGCFVSWRTFKKGTDFNDVPNLPVTNPITWTLDTIYAPKEMNAPSLLRDFKKLYPTLTDAQVKGSILWVTKPKFPWSFIYVWNNFHIADINFYYFSIQNNMENRIKSYSRQINPELK